MKFRYILLFLFIYSNCFSQSLDGIIKDSLHFEKFSKPVFEVKLTAKQNRKTFFTSTNINGRFTFSNLENGEYELKILNEEYKNNIFNIIVSGTTNENLFVKKYCSFNENKSNICPICKSNKNVLPIFYGLTTTTFIKQNKTKYHFSGCQLTGCDPKFYCKKDREEF